MFTNINGETKETSRRHVSELLFLVSKLQLCLVAKIAKIPDQQLNYLFVVYRSTSTDDRVFDCLCEAMGTIQSADPKSVFCFVADFNCHHSDWLGSRITDAHGVAAFDFATLLTVLNWLMDPLIGLEVCWVLF